VRRFEGDEAGFRSWVFSIAHHKLIDDRRRQQMSGPVDDHCDELDFTGDVEQEALDNLSELGVRRLIAGLTPDQAVSRPDRCRYTDGILTPIVLGDCGDRALAGPAILGFAGLVEDGRPPSRHPDAGPGPDPRGGNQGIA
jgi:hypothetical protein